MIHDRQRVIDILRLILTFTGGTGGIANDTGHVLFVQLVALKRPAFLSHKSRDGVGTTRQNTGECRSKSACLIGIVGQAKSHEQGGQIGHPQTCGAEFVGLARNFRRRELAPDNGGLQDKLDKGHGVEITLHVEATRFHIQETQHVD